jgi:hypothetical protein
MQNFFNNPSFASLIQNIFAQCLKMPALSGLISAGVGGMVRA